jgi:hypothetical protein
MSSSVAEHNRAMKRHRRAASLDTRQANSYELVKSEETRW